MNGEVEFTRNWTEYYHGFGHLSTEFWLGNYYIHRISFQRRNQLRVDIGDFDSNFRHAVYDDFRIGRSRDKFPLDVGNYSGDAGDSLRHHHGAKFSTMERDHDGRSDENCAQVCIYTSRY